jgi:ribosomal protein S18 acetylase RimI-like enzyme
MKTNIRTLKAAGLAEVHQCFLRAFSDYAHPTDISQPQFEQMLIRRGYDRELSVGSFVEGELVAFMLIGKRMRTAYDIASGVVKRYRGQGLFTEIFHETIPLLRASGMESLLLEVLKENEGAVKLYRRLGFTEKQSLEFFTGSVDHDDNIEYPVELCDFGDLDLNLITNFWDVCPAWQNSLSAVQAVSSELLFAVARSGDDVVGYGCLDPQTGDMPQIAVDSRFRGRKIARSLVGRLLAASCQRSLKLINIESSCSCLIGFCTALGLEAGGGQNEMELHIGGVPWMR